MKVMKFGGTSVGSIESLRNVKSIVQASEKPVIVVVSAMGGFTNQLLAMCDMAQQQDQGYNNILQQARQRHHDAIDAVVIEAMKSQCHSVVDKFFDEGLQQHYAMLSLNPDLDDAAKEQLRDTIVSHGEILSSVIVSGMFDDAHPHLALHFIKTTDTNDSRILDWEATQQLVANEFSSLANRVHVTQGFISSDSHSSLVTNLGRGGSDYTAAILAALLHADSLEIWTDVDGFMTADPRTHPEATVIPQMTYSQAQAMCDAGAKVIYPPTIAPVAESHIPVWVKNTFNPQAPGTVIVDE